MMYFREVDFLTRKPEMSANWYFYTVYSHGHTYGHYNGCVEHMKRHVREHPDHILIWLEPESEYDPDTYYNRISKETTKKE